MTRKLAAAVAAVVCSAALCSAGPASASTAWRVQQIPAPANGTGQLQAVSCPAADVCFAVGYSADLTTGARSLLAERRAGGQWAIQPIPTPAGSPFGEFHAISCLSVTDCFAIGFAGTQSEATGALAEHWDGISWTIMPSPNPDETEPPDYAGLSCASDTSCTAVGLDFSTGNRPHEVPIAAHWDGTAWTVTRPPLPAGMALGDLAGGVSCPSATYCIAVGSGAAANGKNGGLAERWNGTRWSVQAIVNPAGSVNLTPNGVSCTSPRHCTAVGSYFASDTATHLTPLVERWDGTAWTIEDDTVLDGTGLNAVSCTSAKSCTAISDGFDPTAEHWDGTSWTVQPMPVPHHTTRPVTATGVSCVSASSCTAVGYYGKKGKPLAEHE